MQVRILNSAISLEDSAIRLPLTSVTLPLYNFNLLLLAVVEHLICPIPLILLGLTFPSFATQLPVLSFIGNKCEILLTLSEYT